MIEHSERLRLFWAKPSRHAADFHNRTMEVEPVSGTSMEALDATVPDNSKSRIFGFMVLVHFHNANLRSEFQRR